MILVGFWIALLVIAGRAVVDDIRNGSIFDTAGDAEVIEFPLAAGWTEEDVLRTYAEIEAL